MGCRQFHRSAAAVGVAALLGLCACGEEFGGDGTGGGGTAPPPCSPGNMDTLSDDFENGDFDPFWLTGESDMDVAEVNGRLEFVVPANVTDPQWANVWTAQTYDLRGCYFAFELAQAPSNPTAEINIAINFGSDNDNVLGMMAYQDSMEAFERLAAQETVLRLANFDSVHDRFWRVREQDGTVFFETSPDGTNWVELSQTATPLYADSGLVSFAVSAWWELPSPELVAVDNVNRLP